MAKAAPAEQLRLLDLARLDSEITKLKRTITEASNDAEVDAAQAQLAESGTSLAEVLARLTTQQAALKESEAAVEKVTAHINKDQKRIDTNAGSASDMMALSHEVESLTKRRSDLEDAELELMGELEDLQAEHDAAAALDTQRSAELDAHTARRDAAVAALKEELAAVEARRKDSAATFDEGLFTTYERIPPAPASALPGSSTAPLRPAASHWPPATSRKSRRPRPTKSSSAPTPAPSWSAAANGAREPVRQNPGSPGLPAPGFAARAGRHAGIGQRPPASHRDLGPDFDASRATVGWLLEQLGYVPGEPWANGVGYRGAHDYIVLESGPDVLPVAHQRCAPGVNHLAFAAGSRSRVDGMASAASERGFRLLFADAAVRRRPAALAAYLVDPDGFEFELVAEDSRHPAATRGTP